MWANAQRDGRPAEYRWSPLLNATVWLMPTTRSQPLVGRSSPYYQNMWRRYCCLIRVFPIVDTYFSSEDIGLARQNLRWWQNGYFCVLYFQ